MSKINAFLVVILAFSSICFGATLMQRSMNRSLVSHKELTKAHSPEIETCQDLIKNYQQQASALMANELYKEAFLLYFNGSSPRAEALSKCASQLANGSEHWGINAKDLVN